MKNSASEPVADPGKGAGGPPLLSFRANYWNPPPNPLSPPLNSPFYRYGWKGGWRWPCFDTNLPALSCNSSYSYSNKYFSRPISITKQRRFESKPGHRQPHIHSKARVLSLKWYIDVLDPPLWTGLYIWMKKMQLKNIGDIFYFQNVFVNFIDKQKKCFLATECYNDISSHTNM